MSLISQNTDKAKHLLTHNKFNLEIILKSKLERVFQNENYFTTVIIFTLIDFSWNYDYRKRAQISQLLSEESEM